MFSIGTYLFIDYSAQGSIVQVGAVLQHSWELSKDCLEWFPVQMHLSKDGRCRSKRAFQTSWGEAEVQAIPREPVAVINHNPTMVCLLTWRRKLHIQLLVQFQKYSMFTASKNTRVIWSQVGTYIVKKIMSWKYRPCYLITYFVKYLDCMFSCTQKWTVYKQQRVWFSDQWVKQQKFISRE